MADATSNTAGEGSKRAIIAAFLANLGIAAAKFLGFLVTGAASMLAEAIHSVADTANQALLMLGRARAAKTPTAAHPFGYGRERYFWAFVVALVLFTGGAVFALVEGEEKLRSPHELESPGWALGILAVAFVLEGLSLRTAVREGRRIRRRGVSWWRFVRESRSPDLPVVLLEDSGALLGLTFAAAGIVLAQVTGDARYDALGSLAIGVLLAVIAFALAVETKSLLIGEAADPRDLAAICEVIEGHPDVERVVDLRTEHLGPEQLLVVGTVRLDGEPAAHVLSDVDRELRRRVPSIAFSFLEPVVPTPTGAPRRRRIGDPGPGRALAVEPERAAPIWPVHHLFDLDGVLTDSSEAHARAWRQMFDDALSSDTADRLDVADRTPFDPVDDYLRHVDGRPRREGVVEFLTARGVTAARLQECSSVVDDLAALKDELFRGEVAAGTIGVYDDVTPYLEWLSSEGAARAVVSSSRNARLVLAATGLERWIDVVVDGAILATADLEGKPAPDGFLRAAEMLGAGPTGCAVLEDATVGVEAGRRGGFGVVLGVDRVGRPERLREAGADEVVSSLAELGADWWADRARGVRS